VLLWAIVEPFFTTLFAPFELRSRLAGTKSHEDQLKIWLEVDALIAALGLNIGDELAIMRYGGGWHKLSADTQIAVKARVLEALARQVTPALGPRYRAYRLQSLIANYYKKAKANSSVKRTQALNRALERTVASFFRGDWLAVLDYLGEQPHPDEQVVTALPAPRLFVSAHTRVAEVAAQHRLPVEEIERMLAAFWQHSGGISPVEERVAVLERYWQGFDAAHTRQAAGMPSLWGLVEENFRHWYFGHAIFGSYIPELYRALLPADLSADIERLWSTIMLPRWPDRMVTEPFPHSLMAETLGPALTFWHGCALTAWFICEGPWARTDLTGLAHYHRHELVALKNTGTPVDEQLFQELIQAEKSLGPEQPITQQVSAISLENGRAITVITSDKPRREGFALLRDIITRYRRAWAGQYLNTYLRTCWETELREASRAYHQLMSNKGTPPTLKQFARAAERATNHWFGGHVGALYSAIGEKVSAQLVYQRIMPESPAAFVYTVFVNLGGRVFAQPSTPQVGPWSDAELAEQQHMSNRSRLAQESLRYIRIEEASGAPPDRKMLWTSKLDYLYPTLSDDVEVAWERYRTAIEEAKKQQKKLPAGFMPPTSSAPSQLASSAFAHTVADSERERPST
jgi:hypothetical protein